MKKIGRALRLSEEALANLGEGDIEDLQNYMPCDVYRTDLENNHSSKLLKLEGMKYKWEYIHEDLVVVITNVE